MAVGCILNVVFSRTALAHRGSRRATARARQRLRKIGDTFLRGCLAALAGSDPLVLVPKLNAVEAELRGFAFEGAAMGLTLLDQFTPWRRDRWRRFALGPAAPHVYMAHAGAGMALATLRRPVQPALQQLDHFVRWKIVDGYGFHRGLFGWRRFIECRVGPGKLPGYTPRAFDQGLGRSLWFADGADVVEIPRTIAGFPPSRHADLWSGVGLACAYAGGVERAAMEDVRAAAGPYRLDLAQGAAFAAQIRQHAGNPAPHTDLASEILCGLSAADAAKQCDVAMQHLPSDGVDPAYEVWRGRIRAQLTRHLVLP